MKTIEKKEDGILETVKTVFWALIIAGIFRTLFFQPFWIPSGSMKDTLLIGDFLFVNKMAYGYSRYSCPFSACPITGRILGSEPDRGDVIVFRHPTSGVDYIKRLIGLPGDKVQVIDSVVFINDEEAVQVPDGLFVENYAPQGSAGNLPACITRPGPDGECVKDKFLETLPGGVTHSILNFTDQQLDNTQASIVPEGHYFFMGDNRDNSSDSRVPQNAGGVGMVPFENLVGRADRIVFSSAGKSLFAFWTWRGDRFFKAVE
ncbi:MULTISPECIES: signal peptidase I [Falsihalocynthiibacter]|uniref:Signal peptidase I n=1 Tax=Falsihalocynthiibacter arcticus TaxID=1579316 RepID=A0A126UYW6_9RHOB|nr:signal peptidase I [Falsihalocynthiibacter arcticus]AML51253.1 S26 family signal peptidase [Falsihalocynthiibacter arcticus]